MTNHGDMVDGLDMTMMYTYHAALRRDLVEIARAASRRDDDPRRLLATAAGWELFKKHLYIHHTAEDHAVWPALRKEVANRPDDIELIDAMEAEHAVIDPLIAGIDDVLLDRDQVVQRLGGAVDALESALSWHLAHEEADALPLMARVLNPETMAGFAMEQRNQVGIEGGKKFMPWLLDGASSERKDRVLAQLPPPLLAAYRDEWQPAYDRVDHWNESGEERAFSA